jgi:hypothetical protein
MWLAVMDATRCAARYADGDYTDAILEGTYLEAPVDTEGSIRFGRRCRHGRQSDTIEPNVGSNSQDQKRLDPLWPRLLLCVRGKERQLSVALLCKVVNDLLGWILDITLFDSCKNSRESLCLDEASTTLLQSSDFE